MKKLVLLITGLLLSVASVSAEEVKSVSQGEDLATNRNHFVQPILFIERGVEFLVFPDGSFDFNTELDYTQGDTHYRKTNIRKRGSVNRTFGAPGTYNYYNPRNNGTVVLHDRSGKVRRIGYTFLNYNRYDQIKRIGSVYLRYNRRGLVSQIGGMRLIYNKRGRLVRTVGQVNRFNSNTFNSNNHFNDDDDFDFDYDDDDDYFYYRKGKKIKKPKLKKVKYKKRKD